MASSDVDQKYLGRIAQFTEDRNPIVSEALFQILGLSVVLSRKLYRARKLRRLDTTRDTRSLQLYHHIIWLSKEGLSILEAFVLPYTQDGQEGPECQVLTAKLRASFVHIFCLFHNDPPITVASGTPQAGPSTSNELSPPSPRQRGQYSTSGYETATPQKDITPPKRHSKGKYPSLRDPINSVTSDASFLTNPYAGLDPGESPPPIQATPTFPPGLGHASAVPHPSEFLLPSRNFVPIAKTYFTTVSAAAAALLPGAHPLRLSTALEHAAFLWDCVHDHAGARHLAGRTIRHLKDGEEEGVSDEAFDDAAEMVQFLGRIMKRRSFDTTPRTGQVESAESSTILSNLPQFPSSTAPDYSRLPPEDEYLLQHMEDRQTTPRASQPAPPLVTPLREAQAKPRASSNTSARRPAQPSQISPQEFPASRTRPSQAAPPPADPITPSRIARDSRSRPSAAQPSVEGGLVSDVTPPRRRESTKSSRTRERSGSMQASPQQLQPLPRTPQRTVSRRRQPSTEATPPRTGGYTNEPVTPPRPPPKDPGYTPSTQSTGKTGSRRSSASTGRRVEFATQKKPVGVLRQPEPSRVHVNGNTVPANGYYDDSAADQRGRGER